MRASPHVGEAFFVSGFVEKYCKMTVMRRGATYDVQRIIFITCWHC